MANIVEKLNETRGQWFDRGTELWSELQAKSTGLVVDIKDRRERILESGQKALSGFEIGILTQASGLLGWAYDLTGERSDALLRSRDFILERLEGLDGDSDAVTPAAFEETAAPAVPTKAEVATSGEPFEGYDDLNVKQVVARLSKLSPEEISAVCVYEKANKARKTVLSAC